MQYMNVIHYPIPFPLLRAALTWIKITEVINTTPWKSLGKCFMLLITMKAFWWSGIHLLINPYFAVKLQSCWLLWNQYSILQIWNTDSAKLVSPRSSTDENVGGPVKNMGGPIKLLYITMFKIGKSCKKNDFQSSEAWKVFAVSGNTALYIY